MPNYPLFQLMRENLMQPHDASVKVYSTTPSMSNKVDAQIFRTAGGTTLADSSVVPSKRSQATTFSVTSRSQTKVAVRQLQKKGN